MHRSHGARGRRTGPCRSPTPSRRWRRSVTAAHHSYRSTTTRASATLIDSFCRRHPAPVYALAQPIGGSEMQVNQQQREQWNAEDQARLWPKRERITTCVTRPLLDHLALEPGERVLEIGSGGGLA